jgi:hypothetical protein
MDGNLAMANHIVNAKEHDFEPKVCEVCEKNVKELTHCERCDTKLCFDCCAPYNQFTQIDYDCCKTCAKY